MFPRECRVCGDIKPKEGFYKHPKMKGGRDSVCKECVKERVSKRRMENIEHVRAYDRRRGSLPHRKAAVKRRAGRYASKVRLWRQGYIERNPQKRKAHILVGNAIRDGKLIRQPCERCGRKKDIHAHHEDYSKPMDVVWLCRECHGERHREINNMEREAERLKRGKG